MAAVRTDTIIEELEYIAAYKTDKSPHRFHSNQAIVAELVIKEAARIKKLRERMK